MLRKVRSIQSFNDKFAKYSSLNTALALSTALLFSSNNSCENNYYGSNAEEGTQTAVSQLQFTKNSNNTLGKDTTISLNQSSNDVNKKSGLNLNNQTHTGNHVPSKPNSQSNSVSTNIPTSVAVNKNGKDPIMPKSEKVDPKIVNTSSKTNNSIINSKGNTVPQPVTQQVGSGKNAPKPELTTTTGNGKETTKPVDQTTGNGKETTKPVDQTTGNGQNAPKPAVTTTTGNGQNATKPVVTTTTGNGQNATKPVDEPTDNKKVAENAKLNAQNNKGTNQNMGSGNKQNDKPQSPTTKSVNEINKEILSKLGDTGKTYDIGSDKMLNNKKIFDNNTEVINKLKSKGQETDMLVYVPLYVKSGNQFDYRSENGKHPVAYIKLQDKYTIVNNDKNNQGHVLLNVKGSFLRPVTDNNGKNILQWSNEREMQISLKATAEELKDIKK